MQYQIGDLVIKKSGEEFGVIVGIDKANSKSLILSNHSQQHLKNSSDIYYVFFSNFMRSGPYYTSELLLKQSTNGITIF